MDRHHTNSDEKKDNFTSFINTTCAISLGNVGLNPPLHTQHNEGVGGCNEGNPNATIRQLGVNRNGGGISNI